MNKNSTPLISIITVVYNDVLNIEQTILSVINQTYPNIEYIVIDGGSTDGTTNIIKKYQSRITYWTSEPDKGVFDAMNKGLKKASGEWINFMNSGDKFTRPETINNVFKSNNFNQKIAIFGDATYICPTGKEFRKALSIKSIKYNMPTTHQAFFIKTNIAKEIQFDTSYKYVADYNMIYTILKKFGTQAFIHVDENITVYEACTGLTIKNNNAVLREVLRVRNFDYKWIWHYLKFLKHNFK